MRSSVHAIRFKATPPPSPCPRLHKSKGAPDSPPASHLAGMLLPVPNLGRVARFPRVPIALCEGVRRVRARPRHEGESLEVSNDPARATTRRGNGLHAG